MSLPTLSGIGRLVDDPELRFTPSGKAVAKVRLAFSDRKKDPQTNEWSDGDKCFIEASVWDQEAEHIAESLTRGMEVLVSGKLKQRQYQTREGENRTVFELAFATIAPTLKYATASVKKMQRASSGGQQAPAQGGNFDDPWAAQGGQGRQHAAAQSSSFDSEPPF